MSSLQWHDLIAPTNPFAALFFGLIISLIIGLVIWFETKEKRTMIIGILAGCGTACILVLILKLVGFYGYSENSVEWVWLSNYATGIYSLSEGSGE